MVLLREIRRISVTQPYLPRYRVPLFDAVHSNLTAQGFEFRVFLGCGDEQASQIRERGDAAEADWAQNVPVKSFSSSPGRNPFIYRKLPPEWDTGLLVTEMQVANLNAWRALSLRRPYITIGHGKEYIVGKPLFARRLESVLNRRATHVCTYMEAGRRTVIDRTSLPPQKVTSFGNTTDTRNLTQALSAVTPEDVSSFRELHGIPNGSRIALFIGAVEEYKRIDILVEAFRLVLKADPSWWLIVAGDGSQRDLLEALMLETERVTILGHVSPADFVLPAKIAEVLLNPGRVGLIAVDSLALELPVLTTSGARHAPEAEYLSEGETVITTAPDPNAYSNSWTRIRRPDHFPSPPTIEQAAVNISEAIVSAATEI